MDSGLYCNVAPARCDRWRALDYRGGRGTAGPLSSTFVRLTVELGRFVSSGLIAEKTAYTRHTALALGVAIPDGDRGLDYACATSVIQVGYRDAGSLERRTPGCSCGDSRATIEIKVRSNSSVKAAIFPIVVTHARSVNNDL